MVFPYASANIRNFSEEKKNIQNIHPKRVIWLIRNAKMATAEIALCKKKTHPDDPNFQLTIVRVDNKLHTHETSKNYTHETSKNLYKSERGESTTISGQVAPPPSLCKGFSDSKDFLHHGIFNKDCRNSCNCWSLHW